MGNFQVYKSSAGSGKTYTLVREFLRISLSDEDPSGYRRILAMTFTNKAANEMKDRVISALTAMSGGPEHTGYDQGLVNHLVATIGITEEQLIERATNTKVHLLHNYSDLSISTIDKFTHKVIRTFARDLELPGDFEVFMNTDDLLQRTVDSLLSMAGEDPQVTDTLLNFTYFKADSNKAWNVEKDMLDFSKNLFVESAEEHLKRLKSMSAVELSAQGEKLRQQMMEFEDPIVDLGLQSIKILKDHGAEISSFKFYKNGGLAEYILRTSRREIELPGKRQSGTIEDEKWYNGKADPAQQNAIQNAKPALYDLITRSYSLVREGFAQYRIQRSIYKNFYAMSLIHQMESSIDEIKKDQNILMIADFNKRIAAVIRDEPVPFIYERLGERYDHFLLDEFQDTSLLQWQNIVPLVENSLANGNYNLIVGDGKQAIYRWRNGEVEQFISLPKIYKGSGSMHEREETLIRNYREDPLDRNWRSRKEVTSFNNRLFGDLKQMMLTPHFQEVYKGHEQKTDGQKEGGFVSFEFLHKDRAEYENYLQRTLELVKEVVKDGYELKDIAILCRTNVLGNMLADHLLRNNIPVISSDSLLVGSNDDVNLLIAVLRHLHDPRDQAARLDIIRYMDRETFTSERLFDYVDREHGIQVNLEAFFTDHKVSLSYASMRELPIYELAETLVRVLGISGTKNPYLIFFLEAIHGYSISESRDLPGFLEWWNNNSGKISIKVPESTDAVEILTIHKSKGLQFPVVIAPFVNWKMRKGNETLWVSPEHTGLPSALVRASSKELEGSEFEEDYRTEDAKTKLDHLNLLYVALTRPEDRLYVISDQKGDSGFIRDPLFTAIQQYPEYHSETGTLKFGTLTSPTARASTAAPTYDMDEVLSRPWKDQLHLSLNAPSYWNIDDPGATSRFGNLMHTALSRIEKAGDVARIVDEMKLEGLVDRSLAADLSHELHGLFELPQLADWFSENANSYVECEILSPDGSMSRPDRVVVSGNTATVIDFKTGRASSVHKEQIDGYGRLLEGIGYEQVRKFLVYTSEREIVEV